MAVYLTIWDFDDSKKVHSRYLSQSRIMIGRLRSSDICLPSITVSTNHASINFKNGNYVLCDLGSLNGTKINGRKIVSRREKKLSDGDIIAISEFRLKFKSGTAGGIEESRETSIDQAEKMLFRILSRANVSEEESPGTIVAVKGPGKVRCKLPLHPAVLIAGRDKDLDIFIKDPEISRKHAKVTVEKDAVFLTNLNSRNGIVHNGNRVDVLKLEIGMHFVLGRTEFRMDRSEPDSLKYIFEAPEEETSSFALNDLDPGVLDSDEEPDKTRENSSPSPAITGPVDPLLAESEKFYKTTTELPIPQNNISSRSDLGLIIFGSIIIAASVLGLIYIFS